MGNDSKEEQEPTLAFEDSILFLYDDLGVAARWAQKFSEAGIETVADLVGHTEKDLLRIEGIGAKAIEQLKEGLADRNLSYVIGAGKEHKDKDKRNIRKCPYCKTYIDTGGWKDNLEWKANFCPMCGVPLNSRGADIVRERETEEANKKEWEEMKRLADGANGGRGILLEDLNLSTRAYKSLKRAGIHSAGQLIEFTKKDLLNIRNFGAKSAEEVRLKLAEKGLRLRA